MQLLKAYIEIQNWRFLPSLVALYGAQAIMLAWEKTLQNKEVRLINFYYLFFENTFRNDFRLGNQDLEQHF